MVENLARNWWVLALRGLLGILFGIAAFIWPGLTLAALVLLFGGYAVADGILTIIGAVTGQAGDRWLTMLLVGVVALIAGILTFFWPGITALSLLYIIAAYAILSGIFTIMAAIRLREEIEGELWLGLSGLLSVSFGIAMIFQPGAGALALVWLIGGYALFFGILLIILAFRLRNWRNDRTMTPAP